MGNYDTTTVKVVRVRLYLPDNGRGDADPPIGVVIYQARDLDDTGLPPPRE